MRSEFKTRATRSPDSKPPQDADLLRKHDERHLAAIYLYGYSVEMWLKAAVYRRSGFLPPRKITRADRGTIGNFVRPFAPANIPVGHYLPGWADFLVKIAGFHPALGLEVADRTTALYLRWREIFRYAPNRPSNQELIDVHETATWFKRKYVRVPR